jgi:large subunit ribosomal protein L31
MKSGNTRDIDGVSHYVIKVDISSATHPFYTGKQRLEIKGGRIDRFKRRYQR